MNKLLKMKQNFTLFTLLFTLSCFFSQSLSAQLVPVYCNFTLNTSEITFDSANSDSHPFTISTVRIPIHWTVYSDVDWISFSRDSGTLQSSNTTVGCQVDPNPGFEERCGFIIVSTCNGSRTNSIFVCQTGLSLPCDIEVGSEYGDNIMTYSTSDYYNLNLPVYASNSGWHAYSDRDWIIIDPKNNSSSEGNSIVFDLTSSNVINRVGKIYIRSDIDDNCYTAMNIIQNDGNGPGEGTGTDSEDGGGIGTEGDFPLAEKTRNLKSTTKVFPNPTSNFLNISLNEAEETVYGSLMDISGKVVQNFGLSNIVKYNLDVSNLTSGVYLLKVTSISKTILEEKILIE